MKYPNSCDPPLNAQRYEGGRMNERSEGPTQPVTRFSSATSSSSLLTLNPLDHYHSPTSSSAAVANHVRRSQLQKVSHQASNYHDRPCSSTPTVTTLPSPSFASYSPSASPAPSVVSSRAKPSNAHHSHRNYSISPVPSLMVASVLPTSRPYDDGGGGQRWAYTPAKLVSSTSNIPYGLGGGQSKPVNSWSRSCHSSSNIPYELDYSGTRDMTTHLGREPVETSSFGSFPRHHRSSSNKYCKMNGSLCTRGDDSPVKHCSDVRGEPPESPPPPQPSPNSRSRAQQFQMPNNAAKTGPPPPPPLSTTKELTNFNFNSNASNGNAKTNVNHHPHSNGGHRIARETSQSSGGQTTAPMNNGPDNNSRPSSLEHIYSSVNKARRATTTTSAVNQNSSFGDYGSGCRGADARMINSNNNNDNDYSDCRPTTTTNQSTDSPLPPLCDARRSVPLSSCSLVNHSTLATMTTSNTSKPPLLQLLVTLQQQNKCLIREIEDLRIKLEDAEGKRRLDERSFET